VFGVSVPLPFWDRNRGGIAEAEALLSAARTRRELALRGAESDIRRAWETHRSLEDRMREIGGTLLPESGGLLETARLAYAEGEMSLLELLDAADAYRGARESITALLAEYLSAAYELERATGQLLPTPTAPGGPSRESDDA
jgi:outer membrane protein, heavy metal efflux system